MNKWIVSAISIAAIIISIIALANVKPTQELNFDYMGGIVGVLSFLVTLLIGYQIYTVINVKEELKELQKFRSEINTVIEKKVKGIKEQMDDELNNVLPIMVTMDMREPIDVIANALRVYGEATPDSFAQSFASGIIIITMNEASAYDEKKKEQFLGQLKEKTKYEDVSSYYAYIAKQKRGNDKFFKGIELMLVRLINMYVMK